MNESYKCSVYPAARIIPWSTHPPYVLQDANALAEVRARMRLTPLLIPKITVYNKFFQSLGLFQLLILYDYEEEYALGEIQHTHQQVSVRGQLRYPGEYLEKVGDAPESLEAGHEHDEGCVVHVDRHDQAYTDCE